MLTLCYREYLPRIVTLNLRVPLLALFPSNSGEGLAKVRINAFRVTKGMVKDRLHRLPLHPLSGVIRTSFQSDSSKMRSEQEEVPLVQWLG